MAKTVTIRSKNEQVSFQMNRKPIYIILILTLIALVVFMMSIAIGSSFIHPVEVIKHLFGFGTGEYDFIINSLRLPRTLLGCLVGVALGIAGLILQGVIRNPLASPDIIGITSGASVGAILFIVFMLGAVSIDVLPLWAIAGAGAVSFLIYILSWKNGVTPIRLVLMGIGISAIMKATVTFLLVFSDSITTTKSYIWLTGSLYGVTMDDFSHMFPWVIITIPILFMMARAMNAKELGDELATSLGLKVQMTRIIFLIISVILAGLAVAFAGGIEFVGLIAPHVARLIVGRSFFVLIPVTGLIGGIIVMLSDFIGRTMFLPLDVPAGVFTAAIGAPFFIYLLYKNRNN